MSETRALIAETAARLFDDLCTREVVEQAEAGTWPEALWRTVEETGLTRALLADAAAGEAATFGDAAVIVRCAGRSAVPLPLAETLLAGWLLSGSGLAVPEGPLTIAPTDRGSTLSLAPADGGWRLSGGVRAVPWGRAVRAVALVVDAAHGPLVALVDPADGELHDGHNLAGEPRDDLTFSDLALPGDRVAPAGAGIDGRALRRRGALMRALQMAGALERVLARTVAYASDRVQFGRPIARFQAIQHQLAELASEVAAAGAAVDAAVAAVERGEAGFALAAAKARAGEAAGRACAIAHQVHGAIGFTYEYDLNHSTRRLWSWRDEFGRESEWTRELGHDVMAAGAEALWSLLTSQ